MLITNWRAVICRAYSVHLGAIAFLLECLGILGDNWQLMQGTLPIAPIWFAVLGVAFGLAGLIGRFIPQPKISGDNP